MLTYSYFNSNNILELWIEEKSYSWCPSGGNSVGACTTQGCCQGLCEDSETCIGYSYSPIAINDGIHDCYLCTDDTLIYDKNEYGFYRKPGKKGHNVLNLKSRILKNFK